MTTTSSAGAQGARGPGEHSDHSSEQPEAQMQYPEQHESRPAGRKRERRAS